MCHLPAVCWERCNTAGTEHSGAARNNVLPGDEEETVMGFMDKAKQMAEQAQQKIEDAQKQFNEGQAKKGAPAEGAGVRYDEHGRPVPGDAAQAPSAADPAVAQGVAHPQPPEDTATPPAGDPLTEEQPPPAPPAGTNTNPDPFKPIE
ncbi:MAG: hypothetical protein ACR2FZ_03225 [Thermoleophilaceae bacterium]